MSSAGWQMPQNACIEFPVCVLWWWPYCFWLTAEMYTLAVSNPDKTFQVINYGLLLFFYYMAHDNTSEGLRG